MPELSDPSPAWEDLSAEDRRVLTEMLVDTIIVAPQDRRRQSALHHPRDPVQDPEMEAARLKAVHEACVKIVPRV